MDGPIIALIYKNNKNNEKVLDEEEFESTEENNVYIFLWNPLLQNDSKFFLAIPAHHTYGFGMDENIFQNREEIEDTNNININRFITVIYRPLNDSNIKILNFNENPSSRSSSDLISKIPEFYAKMTTSLVKSYVEEIIWIGTDQKQVICFKNDSANDMKPVWSSFISGIPLSM